MKKIILYLSLVLLMGGCTETDKVVAPVKYNGKFGFIDNKGNWVVEPKFDSLDMFYNGYATSFRNGKEGIINVKGDLVVDHNYTFTGNVNESIALVIDDKERVNFVNTCGKIISKIYFHDGDDFGNGLAPVQFNKGGKWGFINHLGEIVIDAIYDHAATFQEGRSTVALGNLELIIDTQGTIVDTFQYHRTNSTFQLIGRSSTKTLGRINSRGDTIIPMNYESFGYLQGDSFWFNSGEYYGLIDTMGTIISETEYDYLSYFSDNGLAIAKLNNKYGFINKDCDTVIDFMFEDAKGFKYDLAAVKKDGRWGFINGLGTFIIAPKFESVAHHFRSIYAQHEPMYSHDGG